VSDEVFDTIDGVATIYSTIPNEPTDGDLLIPVNDITSGSTTTYKSGLVYKYNES
jgi:hypothetical protein